MIHERAPPYDDREATTGNEIFLSVPAYSMKIVVQRLRISLNSPQAAMPAIRVDRIGSFALHSWQPGPEHLCQDQREDSGLSQRMKDEPEGSKAGSGKAAFHLPSDG